MKKAAAKTDCRIFGADMEPDERIVNYMKERNTYAKTVACVLAVQLFALAVYFLLYALIAGSAFYSESEDIAKFVMIVISAIIAACLCVLNFLTVARAGKVYITKPDSIAIRDAKDAVRLAYDTARPVLIFKITYSLVFLTVSGLVYITMLILMEDQYIGELYGRIACAVIAAACILIAYPCLDRISCYRALLGETHEMYIDRGHSPASAYVFAFVVPVTICAWYVLRYYGARRDIAWIVFPASALLALAVTFLVSWNRQDV